MTVARYVMADGRRLLRVRRVQRGRPYLRMRSSTGNALRPGWSRFPVEPFRPDQRRFP